MGTEDISTEENVDQLKSINFQDFKLMYDLCRYEQVLNPELTSVWCAVFQKEDFQVNRSC